MTVDVTKLAYDIGLLLVGLIKVGFVRRIVAKLNLRALVELCGWLNIGLTFKLSISIVGRDSGSDNGIFKVFG